MNTKPIDAIAHAVLYEGYMLYPYRPSSVKNRQRFNFGVLYPKSYSEAQIGSDAWSMQTEALVEGGPLASIEIRVRFLKLVARSVQRLVQSGAGTDGGPAFVLVSSLEVDGKVFTPWQEAIECEVKVPAFSLDALTTTPARWEFAFPAKNEPELVRDASSRLVGMIGRNQESVHGTVEIKAERAADGVFKVQVWVKNQTSFSPAPDSTERTDEANSNGRDPALMRSLVSAHILLGAIDGQFVSLLEPPESLRDLAATCQNIGAWPVLVGAEGERDTMLASPIILYDYPQIAPESPGDLFDGTEIDEILALRILTMTEDEKNEMRNTDDRARKMLERTESLPMEHLMKLHGTLRDLRPFKEETP
jgi:hydrogenase maturation protease